MPTIYPVSAFKDNYIWILVHETLKQAIVIDPGDAKPAIAFLDKNKLTPVAILITHKHRDHMGGVSELKSCYADIPVYANKTENISETTHFVSDGETITFEQWPCDFEVIEIPGHTLGHVAYYAKPYLFCGDTLFGAGCGRVFEGTAEQMLTSLKKLKSLPDDTLICCGHEYTVANLKFASYVEPDNIDMQRRIVESNELRSHNKPTLPSTMRQEKLTNPFLRCQEKSLIQKIEAHESKKLNSEVDVFHAMREWKNIY